MLQVSKCGCQLENSGFSFWTIANQIPPVDKRSVLSVHFLTMRCDGQVPIDG